MNKLAAIIVIVALAGCATMEPEGSADVRELINQAEASLKRVQSDKGEWRDTSKFLQEAKAALKAGDEERARNLAQKAKDEGDLGYQQAQSQKNAGPWLF